MSITNYINFSQQVYSVLSRTCGINVAKHIVCFYSIILHNVSLGLIVSIFSVVFFWRKQFPVKEQSRKILILNKLFTNRQFYLSALDVYS